MKKSICRLVYPVKFGLPKYAGVEGILFVDAEGHQLFFPSVSFFSFKFNLDMREEMRTEKRPFMYWTSNLHIRAEEGEEFLNPGENAVCIMLDGDQIDCEGYLERYWGVPIRPVKD